MYLMDHVQVCDLFKMQPTAEDKQMHSSIYLILSDAHPRAPGVRSFKDRKSHTFSEQRE